MSVQETMKISTERMDEIRNYFFSADTPFFVFSDDKHVAKCELAFAEGIRDKYIDWLEDRYKLIPEYDARAQKLIDELNRRYDALYAEFENPTQTVILH